MNEVGAYTSSDSPPGLDVSFPRSGVSVAMNGPCMALKRSSGAVYKEFPQRKIA